MIGKLVLLPSRGNWERLGDNLERFKRAVARSFFRKAAVNVSPRALYPRLQDICKFIGLLAVAEVLEVFSEVAF